MDYRNLDDDDIAKMFEDVSLEKKIRKIERNKWITLREWSLRAVLNYRDLMEPKQLKNLPSSIKADLVKMGCKEKSEDSSSEDQLCRFLANLINKEIKILQLPRLYHSYWKRNTLPEEPKPNIQVLMEAIVAECPKLNLLQVGVKWARGVNRTFKPLKVSIHLGGSFFQALPQLASLQVVDITQWFQCDDWALQQFGMHATNIVDLRVKLGQYATSAVGFEALAKLPNLRQFLFGNEYDVEKQEENSKLLLCAKYLPKLRFAGRRFDVLLDFGHWLTFNPFEEGKGYHDEMIVKVPGAVLSLRDLILGIDVHPSQDLQMPELQSLSLWRQMKRSDVLRYCEHFSSITELGLYEWQVEEEPDEDVLKQLLQILGPQLKLLVLYDMLEEPMLLAQILELCPRLERFKISCCTFSKDASGSIKWPGSLFTCMEEAHLEAVDLPPGFIMQLIKGAHKLKKLVVLNNILSDAEAVELIKLAEQRKVLKHIVELFWESVTWGEDLDIAEEDNHKLLLNALQKLPDLKPERCGCKNISSDFTHGEKDLLKM